MTTFKCAPCAIIAAWIGLAAGVSALPEACSQSAPGIIADQEGVYVFIVEGDKAVVRRVTPGGESGTDTVVQKGLSGGEQVIVEGLQSVRPGAVVRATPITPAIAPKLRGN